MAENKDRPVIVKPPLKTPGHWFLILLLSSLFAAGGTWCCWASALLEGGWGWLLLPAGLWLAGALLLVWLSRNIEGATADSTGLTIEKAWQPASRQHIAWSDLRSLAITITPERRGVVRYVVELRVRGAQTEGLVECPYDASLCREIVARARLGLREVPDIWRTATMATPDPFEAMKRLRGKKQRWVWVRSEA